MKVFRTTVHGRRIEARLSDLGSEVVLIDGRPASRLRAPWLNNATHHIDVSGDDGQDHHIEVQRVDLSKLGLGKYRMLVIVDGVERARLEPTDATTPLEVCRYCGYSLAGQSPDNDEVRCPECGRHTPAWKT